MKAFVCLLLLSALMLADANGQSPLPSSGPTFSTKDTTKANVLSVASLQAYPVGIDKFGKEQEEDTAAIIIPQAVVSDPGPIRDWSNPAGYMGSAGIPSAMVRHKPLSPGGYHRKHLRRCYTF